MKKILLLLLVLLSIFLGYSFGFDGMNKQEEFTKPKNELLKIGLVADSHNENELLAKALAQAKELHVDFVIGLGDYTNLGTVEELTAAKKVFDDSGLSYFMTAGDRDGWENRERGEVNLANFNALFGPSTQTFEEKGVQFVLLDNSDIYSGISQEDWETLNSKLPSFAKASPGEQIPNSKLKFVFAHKTPFHPDSAHIMGEDSARVADQAKRLIKLIEDKRVDGLFTGDLHFFATFFASPRIVTKATGIDVPVALHNNAQFSSKGGSASGGYSPSASVKISTIGAVASVRNFQGPRFGVLTIYDDYSWKVGDVPIR